MRDDAWKRDPALYRLTALWALVECGLGGLIHALRVPFTGIVVGAAAICVMALIAHRSKGSTQVMLRALLVVLLVKATASPHTPLPAYLSVTIQGLLATVLFRFLPNFRLAAMLLGVLGVFEGALHKLLVVTILFGKPFFTAVNDLVDSVTPHMPVSGVAFALFFFLLYYLIGGIIVGWLAGRLPTEVDRMMKEGVPAGPQEAESTPPTRPRPRRLWRFLLPITALVLVLAFPSNGGPLSAVLHVLLRAVLILTLWRLLVPPLTRVGLRMLRRGPGSRVGDEVDEALRSLPNLRRLARRAWSGSSTAPRISRMFRFLAILATLVLMDEGDA